MANDPHEIIRLKDIGRYLGIGRTQRDAIIKSGLLRVFPLTPSGRAKGTNKKDLADYQRRVMGLDEDAAANTEPTR